jgi:hypothetical protein
VNRKIAIDVNVLCHLAEFLAGSFILARVRFNLHNVVLPRGWILALLRQITMWDPDTMFVDRLLFFMKVLLEDLIKGGEEAGKSPSATSSFINVWAESAFRVHLV